MRLWSIHPGYLDAKGLVALWREGLLAQHVLLGKTVGYRNHPQLIRFRNSGNPTGAIAQYLRSVADEAQKRLYRFDRTKIIAEEYGTVLPVNEGQIAYEFIHLQKKLKMREPERFRLNRLESVVKLHPLFSSIPGDVEMWEKVYRSGNRRISDSV